MAGHRPAGRIEALISIERADRLERGVDELDSVSRPLLLFHGAEIMPCVET